ncbi:hypothetical protein [Desulfolutivibrio sulfoxidireducens]|uniref:hypothetical protein n=1 Tax=Desulfolutivibrio sulfoxidireducens TaxID=2773299 RepID=UPI00159DAEC1|nr:hypothetical protein [Desulfolutivibrio sulfoxidireducens]QLA15893.1 hypothetical protein GD605_06915 [Desulfolutivibrio sulfoxidireducens]QLA20205.1 hypothetical protein GD604_10985 [Desulfolutivibrio sulfoxidireducens]
MHHALRFVPILFVLLVPLGCTPKKPPQPAQSLLAKTLPAPKAPGGFADIPWGSPSAALGDLTPESAIPELRTTTYARGGVPNAFAGRPVSRILYEFYEDAFYHVWIDFDGPDTFLAVLADLRKSYGPPTQTVPEKHYNAWTVGEVNIYCVYHPEDGTGDASFWFQPIYLKKEQVVKQYKKAMSQGGPPPR